MKCEICHNAPAATAIRRRVKGGEEEELYVCEACARQERKRRHEKSQRTRKVTGLPPGVSMSVTQIGGDGEEAPPPIVEAIVNAFHGMVSDLEKAQEEQSRRRHKTVFRNFPVERAESAYRVGVRLHLEGLHLIGELEAVQRAMRALELQLNGVAADGVKDAGHAFQIAYTGSAERVKRVVEDILREERNARVRLFEEMPRVFGDSLCRALAILKNCRLLAPGELFDLLSPLRLAALEGMLDGISLAEVERLMRDQDLSSSEDKLEFAERDRLDAERADRMNRRFEDVMLNERAEEKLL